MTMNGHPNERDLANFARDALGEVKKRRILAHCRECPPCADRLIEATREHAPPPGPIRLTRWNKISLAALAVALVALVATLVLLMRSLRAPELLEPSAPVEAPAEISEPR